MEIGSTLSSLPAGDDLSNLRSDVVANLGANPSSAFVVIGLNSHALVPLTNTTTDLSNLTLRGVYASGDHKGRGTVGSVFGAQVLAANSSGGLVVNAYGLDTGVSNARGGTQTGTITNA